jgi:lysine-specific demethylase 8
LRTVHAPTPGDFARIVARGEPALLSGVHDRWPALSRWRDADYLRRRVGERAVPVEWYPGGDTSRHAGYVYRTMRVSEFLDGNGPGATYLIVPLATLPPLADDVEVPPILTKVTRTILLYGARTSTNLHFHPFQHSLACQVVGKKTFALYPPEETRRLYPRHWLSKWYDFSRVETLNPLDVARYPRLAQARRIEVTVEPGMALFIPRHWWHSATTDEVASHVLYYFGEREPLKWLWTNPGRRSLFWLGRMALRRQLDRLLPRRSNPGAPR